MLWIEGPHWALSLEYFEFLNILWILPPLRKGYHAELCYRQTIRCTEFDNYILYLVI